MTSLRPPKVSNETYGEQSVSFPWWPLSETLLMPPEHPISILLYDYLTYKLQLTDLSMNIWIENRLKMWNEVFHWCWIECTENGKKYN